jgi:short-subunit dehydrogenase
MGPLEELPIERLRRQLEVNVIGLLAFTQPFLPKMRERHSGWIVNVGSIAGRIATPFMGAYNTSKFALEGLSDALRRELAPFGVHVVLIEPGPIRTQFGAVARQEDVASPGSPYAALRAGMSTAHGGTNLFERSAESVARVILRAVRSPHPRARYTVTLPAKLGTFAYRLVPALLVDWAMNRAMRLRGGFER